ncbi:hypothetical protein BDM02DRAFT_3111357 [Thelephora ganbajun]|uniref:Uncharacterized protein n=1 Tax=Thelephora ganbajun TaxID=370292 RepID=A0ACB6ZNY8_THEGA|nr:hypothetical protein BDM02DRAFT_3111357 [Thelephora ganbajun]
MSPIPTIVHLDEQHSISAFMAAGLTAAAVQHVLFLKNQIPFPVAQLGRLPFPPNSKSSKKRIDLLDAVDTLSCHLHSTFSALSSSLALNSLKYPHKYGHAQVHLLILLGPSLSKPRSRIFLTIDGLKIQAWGHGTEGEALTHYKDENQCGGRNIGNKSNTMHGLDQVRSPLSLILPPTTNAVHESDATSPEPTENRTSLDSTKSSLPSSPPSGESLAGFWGGQQALSVAERLLSRSLTMACAGDGITLNVEQEPTQTHVLLQAPRRFHHPSWIPRQNMSPALDSVLDRLQGHEEAAKKGRADIKTDEVVIRCNYAKVAVSTSDNPESVEADDLIWWSWDGKIVGFGDL